MTSEAFPADRPGHTVRQRTGAVLSLLRADVLVRTLLLPLAVVASLLLALPALSAAEDTITGTVALPTGYSAPEGGMYIEIYAEDLTYQNSSSLTSVFIPENDSTATYSLTVPSDTNASWRIYYYCYDSSYFHLGYYSSTGTRWQYDRADLLQGGDNYNGIDLTLLTANTISGTISLPDNQLAPADGLSFNVNFMDGNTGYGTWVTIPADANASDYTISLPADANAAWQVSYSYWGGGIYLDQGYYSQEGTQWQSELADLLPGGATYNDVDLTLLVANTISGTVYLPEGQTAPEGGMYVDVSASNQNGSGYGSATAYIEYGQSNGPYTLTVPPDDTASWRVSYSYWGDGVFLHDGYYSEDGTLEDSGGATLLAGGDNYTGIDLTLLTANAISGIVSLPAGHFAPEGGMSIYIVASDQIGSGYTSAWASIEAGAASGTYTLILPRDPTASWLVYYNNWNYEAYLNIGYYCGTAGTQWQSDQAELLSGETTHSDINLTLLTGNTISGTVFLPPDHFAPAGGLSVSVSANDDIGSGSGSASAFIEGGQNSGTYTMTVPPDANAMWRVSYYDGDSEAYYSYGYYNETGTTSNYLQATLLSGTESHNNINLTLLLAQVFNGTVTLPQGQKAPAGDLTFQLNVEVVNAWSSYGRSFTIPEGEASTTYSIKLPPAEAGATYRLSYSYYGSEPYLRNGYYSTTGTQWRSNLASLLPGGITHNNLDLTLLTGSTLRGVVALPDDQPPAAGDMYIDVSADNVNGSGNGYGTAIILAGNKSGAYTISVPPDTNASWRVNYYNWDWYWGDGVYYYEGYYNTSGTQWRSDLASPLSGGVDHDNLNMTLLTKGIISGTITLPSNQVAPAGGLEVSISAEDVSTDGYGYGGTSVTIAEGQNSVDYTLGVPPNPNASWRVQYSLYGDTDYYDQGYYSSSGTQWQEELTTLLTGSTEYSDVDLTVLQGTRVSGTLRLPEGTFSQDSRVYFYAYDPTSSLNLANSSFRVTQGTNQVAFSFLLPPEETNFNLKYFVWPTEATYFNTGYLTTAENAVLSNPCEPEAAFTLNSSLTGLDVTLVKAPSINGTISLPSGEGPAATDIPIELDKLPADAAGYYSDRLFRGEQLIVLPAGQTSVDYSLMASYSCGTPATFVVGYRQTNDAYVRYGYYGNPTTKGDPNNGLPLVQNQDYADIDMQLMAGRAITGTISLPGNTTLPANGLPVTLGALAEPNSLYHTTVTIPAGSESAGYTVRVAEDMGEVALGYWLPDNAPVGIRGYYRQEASPNYVTGRYDLADKETVGNDVVGKDFTLATGNTVGGTINLPEAISRAVPIVVSLAADPAVPESRYWHTAVVVPGNSASTAYSRQIILDSPATMKFANNAEQAWVPQGFYLNSTTGTPRVDQATVLQAYQNHPETNLFVTAMVQGDTNYDGQVNMVDAILNLKVMAGGSVNGEDVTPRADVNGDGSLGMPETLYIMKELSN